jgi:hypothetical protein
MTFYRQQKLKEIWSKTIKTFPFATFVLLNHFLQIIINKILFHLNDLFAKLTRSP